MENNLEIPFNPLDIESRIIFLDKTMFVALDLLNKNIKPIWGQMTAQQMVEHLIWSFDLSIGKAQIECLVPETRIAQIMPFVFNDQPNPKNFQHPALISGLPPLTYHDLPSAISSLRTSVQLFLEQYRCSPSLLRTHPLLGPIGSEEWSRLHYKHCYHHLLQFALIVDPTQRPA